MNMNNNQITETPIHPSMIPFTSETIERGLSNIAKAKEMLKAAMPARRKYNRTSMKQVDRREGELQAIYIKRGLEVMA